MKVRDVIEALKKDTTPKSYMYFDETVYFYTPEEKAKSPTCAIGGAAKVLGLRGSDLAARLGAIKVPELPEDKFNLLSPNYHSGEPFEMRPTLRKRIEYYSDGTNHTKKWIAQKIEKDYPELLDVEVPEDYPDEWNWETWEQKNA